MTMITFAGLGISEPLAAKLAEYGITEPSPVQAETIPAALEGRDVLAQSQTGTGKTLAYLLPLLQRINPEEKTLQGLILAPTQELAIQILREAEKYGEALGVQVQALIGGAAIKRQIERLRLHPQLVVGTPGRIREIVALRKLKLHTVRTVVVDEVDQMFQLGGTTELEHILRGTLRERQLMFLSATINPQIRAMAAREMKDQVVVGIEPEQRTSKSLEHVYFICDERDKIDTLRRIVRHYNPARTIVFINNTDNITEVEAKMNHVGLSAGALYGDADKTARSLTLQRFRDGKHKVLVASDVAARGLDIEDLALIVNLDPPIDSEHYVHRAGRTGRMGNKGLAVSIVTPKEEFIMRKFSKELGIEITSLTMYAGKVMEPQSGMVGRDKSFGSSGDKTRLSGRDEKSPVRKSDVARTSATRPSSRPAKPKASTTADKRSGTPNGARKRDRDLDRKNKGAPKWLKNKPPRD
ncbi:superfamily II DNA/RNA helicase [Paenibacillus anaericanus]|uniref:DEAD/DEAH box helicase n=1 Tax=Paenibacillus anaericanus TaxID=170367 RepID=UPI0027815A87|nr:DEAD/DEAH box helicase [Paenibacillus anaericanus]MDQ0090772.1 superfamily II DNA/RNA helicase [Paenibacillus anaericanus]